MTTEVRRFWPRTNDTMDEKIVRIRLKFQEPDILTNQQMEEGLAQSWYLVLLDDMSTVADIAFDIRASFQLEEACPNGLSLEMDGFLLPFSQPARLLKDSDLIRIKRRTDLQGHSRGGRNTYDRLPSREWFASGLNGQIGYHGMQLRALEEFEKETGGYESEREGEMDTEVSLDGEPDPLKGTKPLPIRRNEKDRSGKTHKRSKPAVSEVSKLRRPEEMEAGQELAIVQVKDKGKSFLKRRVSGSAGKDSEAETENDEENNLPVALFPSEGKSSPKKEEAFSQKALGERLRREQKRKRKEANTERHGEGPQNGEEGPSGDVQSTVNGGEKKVKRKKLKHSAANADGAAITSTELTDKLQPKLTDADCEDGLKEGRASSGKKKRRKSSDGVNENHEVKEGVSKKGKGMAADKCGEKRRRNEAEIVSPAEKIRMPESGGDLQSTPARTPKNDAIRPNEDHRPSRSARRKKAKRQFQRAQAKMALLAGMETEVPGKSYGSEVRIAEDGLDVPPAGAKPAEVEAEEEVLPIVVRAGHIRFEPFEEDERPDQSRSFMPGLQLGNQVRTKRQGQNWGQERSAERQKGNGWSMTETDSVQYLEARGDGMAKSRRIENPMDPAALEKHPALDGTPQEGDVLAYRLVELTASWTPEISPYRVGIVTHWDRATSMIKVDPHPDYPRPGIVESDTFEDEKGHQEQEIDIGGLYDENGVLDIEFSSLVEVRLMHRVQSENHEIVPAPREEIGTGLDPTTSGAPQGDISTLEPVADFAHSAPTQEQRGAEDGETAPSWNALFSEEIERKQKELGERDGPVKNASTGSTAPSEELKKATGGSDGGGMNVQQPKTGRGRKFKFLKSAGVGSIVALLRAEQAL